MVTILLVVSRHDFLERVITSLELQVTNLNKTNILCIVDGNTGLFVKTRNLINGTKFNKRLTVQAMIAGTQTRYDIPNRRLRIAAIHNQARGLIDHDDGYVLSVEDDTLFGPLALKHLLKVAQSHNAAGIIEGVELGRWGVPYVGAWIADNIYDPRTIVSIDNIRDNVDNLKPTPIDGCGLYCALIKTDLYKKTVFRSDNGLGPDINFAIDTRCLGYQHYIVWQVPCTHLNKDNRVETSITPSHDSTTVTMTKESDTTWHISY